MLWLVLPLGLLVGAASAVQEQRPMRQLPPPTDIDPKLTEQARQLEQQLIDAILGKDAEAMDRLVAPEFTLRVADVPQSSLPRTMWLDNLKRLKPEPRDQRHHAARKLADDLAVVSLVETQKGTTDDRDFSGDFYIVDFWKRSSADWRIIARYSSPVGKPPDRPLRQLPPPTDIDPQLTDLLRQREQDLDDAAPCTDTKTQKPWSALLAPSSRSACRMLLSEVSLVPCGANRPAPTKSSLSRGVTIPRVSSRRIWRLLVGY